MIMTTSRSIFVFKPVLLAGAMSVGMVPVVGHAFSSIGVQYNADCNTTAFTGSNCTLCHSSNNPTGPGTTPSCPTTTTVDTTTPAPAPVAPPPEPVAAAPVTPPPDPVATAPVAPPPEPVATAPVTPAPDQVAIADTVPHGCTDEDKDGFAKDGGSCGPMDCRDSNPQINPGAGEICDDGIDNNCNGLVDLADNKACDVPVSCVDGDGDGFYAGGSECGPADCDDGNWLVNPGENEVCTDGIDNNCNARVDGIDIACQVRDHERDHEHEHEHDRERERERERDYDEDRERDHHGDHSDDGDHD